MSIRNLPHLEGSLATPGRVGFDYSIGPSIAQDALLERVHIQLNAAATTGQVVLEIRDASSALAEVTLVTGDGTETLIVGSPPTIPGLTELFLRLTEAGAGAIGLSGWVELTPSIVVTGGDLTTLALVRAFRGTDPANTDLDPLITTKIAAVSTRMRRYMRREITLVSPAPEILDGNGTVYGAPSPIQLLHYPVQSIGQVDLVSGSSVETLVSADYEVDASAGLLWYTPGGSGFASWPRGIRSVHVTYTGGFVVIPADIVEAATIQVAWDLKRAPQGGDRLGSRSTDVGEGTNQFLLDAWAPEVLDTMGAYKAPARL